MTGIPDRLAASLSDRYRLERELGQGGMARELVTEVTARPMSLKRQVPGFRGHFSDLSRVATERHRERTARPGARESLRAASAADPGAYSDA